MSRRFFCRRRAERFAQLLDEANGGRRHHIRSRVDDDLAELLAVGQRVREAPPSVEVSPDFRGSLRAMLVATAEREGIGATAGSAEEPSRGSSRNGPGRGLFHPGPVRARGAILVGFAAGAIAVSGMSAASENAVPGDALYGMKRSTERAQLALASSDLSRGQLYLDFAQTRLGEAAVVRGEGLGFAQVLDDMDADTRQGVKLLTTSAMQRKDEAALDAIVKFFTSQRRQVSGLLDRATSAERDRAQLSLHLLDSIKKRADGLRTTLRCGAPLTPQADVLGPLPSSCAASKAAPALQPSSGPEHRSGGRAPEPTRTAKADPSRPPEITPTTPSAENAPKLTKPGDARPPG